MSIEYNLVFENSKQLNVLYVEDAEQLRSATSTLLMRFFNRVDVAIDGLDGYTKYQEYFKETKNYYDIVITDIDMPNLNGIEMSYKIVALNHEQAIIFMTAYIDIEYLNRAVEIGVESYLSKPLKVQKLQEVLYKVCQKVVDKKLEKAHYSQIEEQNLLYIDKVDARHLSVAQDIIDDLVFHKEEMSLAWCANSIVRERLLAHGIDVEYFRTHFGIKVIEYFLGVVQGTSNVGNCPVVFIMLDYFKQKELPLHDIFMICVHFKNSLTTYIFKRYTFNQALFEDVSLIVDKNFEGVVKNYLDMKGCNPKEIEEEQVRELEEEQEEEVTSYIEYVLEQDVYELQDLEEDIDNLAIAVSNDKRVSEDDIVVLGSNLKRYGSILTKYHLFNMLGLSILKLGVSFQENAQVLVDSPEKRVNITTLLEGFVNDLIVWRREIFENNIENPYFLNDSFFSNVDTIIMFMEYDASAEVPQGKDEDLDFFDF